MSEAGKIKGNKSKYYNKSENKEVVKYSKYVNLGVNSGFDIDDDVIVMSKKEYDTLMNGDNLELSKSVADKDNIIDKLMIDKELLSNELRSMGNNNVDNANRIAELTTELKAMELELMELTTVMKQYNITSADELNTIFIDIRNALSYLSDCLNAYEKQGRIKRFFKENPTLDIDKPILSMIDYKGNINAGNGAEISANKVDDSTNSE